MEENINKEVICLNIEKVIEALDTISMSGYKDCKTYSNCIEALTTVKEQISSLKIESTEGD